MCVKPRSRFNGTALTYEKFTLKRVRNLLATGKPSFFERAPSNRKYKKMLQGFDPRSDSFLCFYHLLHTVPAEDIDLFRGSDALTAAGANQLPRAARAFLTGDHHGSRAGRSDGSDVRERRESSAADFDLAPTLLKCIFKQVVSGRRVPSVAPTLHTGQAVGLSDFLEFPVVVAPAPADLLDPVLPAVEVYHLMQHRVDGLLDGIAQDLSGNIDLVGVILWTPPDLSNGAVAEGAGLALDGDDRHGQLIVEEILIQAVVDVLKLGDGAGHFGSLFHGVYPPNNDLNAQHACACAFMATTPHRKGAMS